MIVSRTISKGGWIIEDAKIYESLLEADQLPVEGDTAAKWLDRGQMLFLAEEIEHALWCFQAASECEPVNGPAIRSAARALYLLGREKEAFDRVEQAYALGLARFEYWLGRGFMAMDEDRQEEACWCFEAAIEIKNDDPTAWFMRGMMEGALGRCEDALVSLGRSLDLDPQRATAWALTGEMMEALGRTEEARVCLETAAKLGF